MAARAKEQFDGLQAKVTGFSENNPIRAGLQTNAQTAEQVLKIPEPPELPRLWGALVGEVVGNCVSSLNYLVQVLIRKTGGDPDGNAAFPISESEASYFRRDGRGRTYRDRLLKGMAEAAKKKIDDLQPWHYPTSHRADLALLKALRDAAEHRKLQAAYLAVYTPSGCVSIPTHMPFKDLTITFMAQGGIDVQAQFAPQYAPSEFDFLIAPQVKVDRIAFEPVFGTDPARLVSLAELKKIVRRTGGIIEWFSPDAETP